MAKGNVPAGQIRDAEVVIYGGTGAGMAAAPAAAREGRTVLIIEPSRWIGGLLGAGFRISEDTPFAETLGGLTRKFLDTDVSWGGSTLDWKANANQRLFREMMAPCTRRIRVACEHRLRSVIKQGAHITAIEVE